MKSRASSYKMTWLKKNLTRFMPFWVLYTLCLMLGLFLMAGSRDKFYFIMNLAECARIMAVINCGYALLTAQLLFGDLYSSRMCYGIHSLPLRREEIFAVNVVSGLLFSLVPTALMTLCALLLSMGSPVERSLLVPLLWFAAANLQYLLFFSLAVFCVFCAGSRFSMAVIYGILNFGSLLVYMLTEALYMPLLPGVSNPFEKFRDFCPVGKIAADPLLILERSSQEVVGTFEIQGENWAYLGICAAVSLLLLILALEMYRKRSLETAGEFIAVRTLKPVFLVLFSLSAATALNMFLQILFNARGRFLYVLVFTAAGLGAGWFVGLMLLEKTSRVFTKKTFTGAAVLFSLAAVSLLLTHLDVLGLASWVPEVQDVESVYVIPSYQSFGEYWTEREHLRFRKPEDLQRITEMHELAVLEGLTENDACWYYERYDEIGETEGRDYRYTVPVSLEYHLKDGSIRRRFYYIYADGEAGEMAEKLYSTPAIALREGRLPDIQGQADWINVQGQNVPEAYMTEEDTQALLRAISQDLEEGHMAQMQEFHPVPVWQGEHGMISSLSLSMGFHMGSWTEDIYLDVYSDSVHTFKWLRDRGIIESILEDARAGDAAA